MVPDTFYIMEKIANPFSMSNSLILEHHNLMGFQLLNAQNNKYIMVPDTFYIMDKVTNFHIF